MSDRLQVIADRIEAGETMADIGTDHGFLPIYLIESGISPRVILTDVSGASLNKGEINFRTRLAEEDGRVDFREGNGLSVLAPGEVDVIVIAGMGGKLIRDILRDDIELTRSFGKFILQPRIRQGELRSWLLDNDFAIIREDVVREGRHISQVITAAAPDATSAGCIEGAMTKARADRLRDEYGISDEMFYEVPPWITGAAGPVREFIEERGESEKRKLESVMLSKKRDRELESRICENIRYMKALTEGLKDG